MQNFIDFACTVSNSVLLNEPMSRHTTFKIGGEADVFVEVNSEKSLKELIKTAKEEKIPYMILGNGSNLLISDSGIEGAVFHIGNEMSDIKVDGNLVTAYAGARLIKVCEKAKEASLSGIEFAYGIPGNVGGAVFMNAGAYGGEIKDIIKEARVLTADGDIKTLKANEMEFSYRTSVFKESNDIIISATFKLQKNNKTEIEQKMNELMGRRRDKQPLEFPSAGSTFKRPEGAYAGTLIEQCGLKGYSVGGAQVSEKHAGFVINKGNAQCEDVLNLIKHVQKTVKTKTGFMLEPEVIPIGRRK